MALPVELERRIARPLIAAPVSGGSGPQLVIESCARGVMRSFPSSTCRSTAELDEWLAGWDGARTATRALLEDDSHVGSHRDQG